MRGIEVNSETEDLLPAPWRASLPYTYYWSGFLAGIDRRGTLAGYSLCAKAN
jgi:hypothetical protein